MSAMHGRALAEVEHAEVGLEGRERIGGDLGVRPRERREQRGLAGVGQPDEADVGEQLEREREPELLAVQALLGELGRLARRALEADVAAAALAAARDEQALALAHEVAEQRAVGVAHLGADRHLRRRSSAPSAPRLLAPRPWPPLAARKWCLWRKWREVVQLARGDEHDVAAGRAVAAVGPALGHVLLAAEAHGAVAAATSAHADAGPVEHDVTRPADAGPAQASGTTEMKRPAPFSVNTSVPVTLAKMVWSTPMPAFSPGRNLRAALAHDDRSCRDDLAGERLDAEALAPRSRDRCGWCRRPSYAPPCLLVLLEGDRLDRQLGETAAMTLRLLERALRLVREDLDLLAEEVLADRGLDLGVLGGVGVERRRLPSRTARASSVMLLPSSASTRSTTMVSPALTLNCCPPHADDRVGDRRTSSFDTPHKTTAGNDSQSRSASVNSRSLASCFSTVAPRARCGRSR